MPPGDGESLPVGNPIRGGSLAPLQIVRLRSRRQVPRAVALADSGFIFIAITRSLRARTGSAATRMGR